MLWWSFDYITTEIHLVHSDELFDLFTALMFIGVKWYLLLKKMGLLKLEFYLTTLSMPEMILEVYVTEIVAYFVMVSLNFLSNVDLVTY